MESIDEDRLRTLPEAELERLILQADSDVLATEAAHAWLTRVSFPKGLPLPPVPLPEALTPEQRAVAAVTARREGLALNLPFALPRARITRARWLGLEPPSILERTMTTDLFGDPVSLPLWEVRRRLLSTAGGLGDTIFSPRERLDVYAEILLHGGYDKPSISDHPMVWSLLVAHGPALESWADALLREAKRLWALDGPNASAERGSWTSRRANELLAHAMLYPLALAGRTLGPEECAFVPFRAPVVDGHDLGRVIFLAIREDLREPTLLEAYEQLPTLTAVQIATDVLRFLPLPGLAARAARDFHDRDLKKSVPKVTFERLAARVRDFCADMPELAPCFDKPGPSPKRAATTKKPRSRT